jgi:transcription-repair coupling factor (superfamily II helicase)
VLGEDWVTLFEHLPDAAMASDPDAPRRRDRFVALAGDAFASGGSMPVAGRDQWEGALATRSSVELPTANAVPRFVESKAPHRAFARAAKDVLGSGGRVMVLGAARDLRFLNGRIAKALGSDPVSAPNWREFEAAPPGTVALMEMPVDQGWCLPDLLVVAAGDLLGSRASTGEAAHSALDVLHGGAGEIRLGDVVVHEDFGIGRVVGLEAIDSTSDDAEDAIVLEYAGETRRLVPVSDADRLWRYGADADAVTLDRLDGSGWEKRRSAIDSAIAESARGLTALAAERDARSAAVVEPDPAAYERFASGFPFTETPDQARAIGLVRTELASGKPMDRLVVGDVGYGKTEVAIRAAALTALAGKQVVIAAPTTVLVRQHLAGSKAPA